MSAGTRSRPNFLEGESLNTLFIEPGHFYSPVPSREDAEYAARRAEIDTPQVGIDIDLSRMRETWDKLHEYMLEARLSVEKGDCDRYYLNNEFFSYGDALVYYAMLCIYRPAEVVEIGSGYSSALLLDTVERIELNTNMTFIEPYPNHLNMLMREEDKNRVTLIESKIQEVDLALFDTLQPNDILFIDSSHIAKSGSDLIVELFDVLPRLEAGVIVHFHDIFSGFEYPRSWLVDQNRGWNECYFLRAFLMHNPNYEILFFNDYFARFCWSDVQASPSDFKKNPGGSLWLRRTGDP